MKPKLIIMMVTAGLILAGILTPSPKASIHNVPIKAVVNTKTTSVTPIKETNTLATAPDINDTPVTTTIQLDPVATNQAISYTVIDKTGVMTSANVPIDQQTVADEVITRISNWQYKSDKREVNLCSIYPSIKMAPEGADYLDNPVTQLSWCNKYLTSRYGSWQAALDHLNATGSLL